MIRAILIGWTALAAAACAPEANEPAETPAGAVSFVVIGDTPYSSEDERMLAGALPLIKSGNYPFIIHLGDYKGGRSACTTDHDDRFAALIDALKPTPVFYTPGDNEWTDCDRHVDPATGRNYSDLARLATIRARFFSSAPPTPRDFLFARQPTQVENATWRYRRLRFATLHVVGTANGRDWVTGDPLDAARAAVDAREAANAVWLAHAFTLASNENADAVVIAMQADPTDVADDPQDLMCEGVADHDAKCDAFTELRAALRDAATRFGKPVLLIHGDTAPFTLDQTLAGEEAPNLWRLNAAGDTGEFYGTRDVTLVSIDTAGAEPFSASGLMSGKAAKD